MQAQRTVGPASAGDRWDRWLALAIRGTAVLLVLTTVGLGAYWYYQRYIHTTVSVVDRDQALLESQIRQQPNDPQLRVAMANLYLEKGGFDEAIVQAKEALQANPGNLPAILALSQSHLGKGNLDQAAGYLSQAIDANRDNPMAKGSLQLALAHQMLGDICLRQSRTDEAIVELRAALEIDRANADTLRMLGGALASEGQTEEAVRVYRQALRLVPDFPEVWTDLQRLYEQQGDHDQAAFAAAMVSLGAGRYEEASAGLQRAVEALPDLPETHLGLAIAYEKTGQSAEALAEYRKAAALDPTSVAARQGAGRLGGGQQ